MIRHHPKCQATESIRDSIRFCHGNILLSTQKTEYCRKILMVQCLQSGCLDRTQSWNTLHIVFFYSATAIYGILDCKSRFMEAMPQNPDMAGAWVAKCPSPCWSFRQMLISRHRSCPFFVQVMFNAGAE